MKIREFGITDIKKLWRQEHESTKFDNGQISIIGGSELFHGAPLFALKAASRMVDMVYFACPEIHKDVADRIKAQIGSFIWVPFEEIDDYIAKSDAALIGPGLMRFRSEKGIHSSQVCDYQGKITRELTERLLKQFPNTRWVIDGGSLQVIHPDVIPNGAIVTPNSREFEMLFGIEIRDKNKEIRIKNVGEMAKKHQLIIVLKGPETIVSNGDETIIVKGGSAGLTKGGTGDLIAGITTAMLSKNEPLLAAAAANFLVKKTAEDLEVERGLMFSIDDVVERVPITWKRLTTSA